MLIYIVTVTQVALPNCFANYHYYRQFSEHRLCQRKCLVPVSHSGAKRGGGFSTERTHADPLRHFSVVTS